VVLPWAVAPTSRAKPQTSCSRMITLAPSSLRSKRTHDHANIRRFIYFLLACNAAEVAVVFLALAAFGESALTPVQILFVNLLTDGLPALALGVEPAEPGIMRQAPRSPDSGLISKAWLATVAGMAGLIAIVTLSAFAIGTAWENDDLASSFAFATLVGSQLAASVVFRNATEPAFRLRRNLWLLGALLLGFGPDRSFLPPGPARRLQHAGLCLAWASPRPVLASADRWRERQSQEADGAFSLNPAFGFDGAT
jgi:hypothetical protein